MASPVYGAGFAGAGLSPSGLGSPATASAVAARFLLTPSGAQGTAPLVDPATLDLALDASGNVLGADSVDQSVQLALMTERGSALDPAFGLRRLPGVMLPNIGAIAGAYVREALARPLARGLIELVAVDVTKDGSRLSLVVRYRNLATRADRRVELPL